MNAKSLDYRDFFILKVLDALGSPQSVIWVDEEMILGEDLSFLMVETKILKKCDFIDFCLRGLVTSKGLKGVENSRVLSLIRLACSDFGDMIVRFRRFQSLSVYPRSSGPMFSFQERTTLSSSV